MPQLFRCPCFVCLIDNMSLYWLKSYLELYTAFFFQNDYRFQISDSFKHLLFCKNLICTLSYVVNRNSLRIINHPSNSEL